MDVEAGFGGDAVVEVAGASLDVDARFFGKLWDAFACGLMSLVERDQQK